jgi:hypothetical protein
MRIRTLLALFALVLAQAAVAQRGDPRPGIQANLPPAQPAPEISRPTALMPTKELPPPIAQQCMKERTVPCAKDPKRECKVVEIADCK